MRADTTVGSITGSASTAATTMPARVARDGVAPLAPLLDATAMIPAVRATPGSMRVGNCQSQSTPACRNSALQAASATPMSREIGDAPPRERTRNRTPTIAATAMGTSSSTSPMTPDSPSVSRYSEWALCTARGIGRV